VGLFKKPGVDQEHEWETGRSGFLAEEEADARRLIPGQLLRLGLAFGLLFAVVFFFFWWSGMAIQFGAARVAERPVATWKVVGTVVDQASGEPVPWASIRDSPEGRPPLFEANADAEGRFELLTLAEPHRVLVNANGYRTQSLKVGRQWFIWWPSGVELVHIRLVPE
jgi:hypothetical protein